MPDYSADRIAAAQWASSVLTNPEKYAVLDTETTGLGGFDEIVQIAITDATGATLLDSLVKPTVEISAGASAIHGITEQDLIEAPTFDQVFLMALKAIAHRNIIIYNKGFDLRMIRQSLRAHGIWLFANPDQWINGASVECAMLQYSAWCGEWNNYHNSYRWQKLPGGDHSALGDCRATVEVIRKMAGVGEVGQGVAVEVDEYDDVPF